MSTTESPDIPCNSPQFRAILRNESPIETLVICYEKYAKIFSNGVNIFPTYTVSNQNCVLTEIYKLQVQYRKNQCKFSQLLRIKSDAFKVNPVLKIEAFHSSLKLCVPCYPSFHNSLNLCVPCYPSFHNSLNLCVPCYPSVPP